MTTINLVTIITPVSDPQSAPATREYAVNPSLLAESLSTLSSDSIAQVRSVEVYQPAPIVVPGSDICD